MAKVVAEISSSLDGYVAGPNQTLEEPLGKGGDRLHEWAYPLKSFREPHGLSGGETGPDDELLAESFRAAGAVVMGRRMFSGGAGPWEADPNADGWWGDEPPFHTPVFVVTHHAREPLAELQGGTSFTFVTDGIESALEQARAVEQPRAAAEQQRHNVQVQLVEQAGREVLLHDVGAAAERDVPAAGGREGLLERRLDPVGDEREARPALQLGERLARVVGEHEDRVVERRVLAPPAVPARLAPRPRAAAEHIAAHDRRADVLERALHHRRARVHLAALLPVRPAPRRERERPPVQMHPALPERLLDGRVGAGDEAVE